MQSKKPETCSGFLLFCNAVPSFQHASQRVKASASRFRNYFFSSAAGAAGAAGAASAGAAAGAAGAASAGAAGAAAGAGSVTAGAGAAAGASSFLLQAAAIDRANRDAIRTCLFIVIPSKFL